MSDIETKIEFLSNQIDKVISLISINEVPEIMDLEAFCKYAKTTPGYAYKLTSSGQVPHYKPRGGKLFFKKSEVDQWLLQNKTLSTEELKAKTEEYLMKSGGRV